VKMFFFAHSSNQNRHRPDKPGDDGGEAGRRS
jgi:hypothetical protein